MRLRGGGCAGSKTQEELTSLETVEVKASVLDGPRDDTGRPTVPTATVEPSFADKAAALNAAMRQKGLVTQCPPAKQSEPRGGRQRTALRVSEFPELTRPSGPAGRQKSSRGTRPAPARQLSPA